MTHASVFSGIGGPEVAAAMLGWENLFHCEINPFGRAVLDYHFPNSKSYEDITKTDFREWRGRVNVLTGGFPCQPFSFAGQRRGAQDDRYLWPHMFRCIDEIRPDWVVAENVAGILTMVEQGEVSEVASEAALFDPSDVVHRYRLRETFTLERICRDLESHGYAVQPVLIPACAVGAPHRRDRVFIVANAIGGGTGTPGASAEAEGGRSGQNQQPGERRATTERDNRLHAVLRHAADPAQSGAESLRRAGQDALHAAGTTADTPEQRSERLRPEQPETGRAAQEQSGGGSGEDGNTQPSADNDSEGLERRIDGNQERPRATENRPTGLLHQDNGIAGCSRWDTFPSVSPVHRGNDGLPFRLDDLTIPPAKWRTESLKAYGNAIVPQVMYEIFRAIQLTYNNGKT